MNRLLSSEPFRNRVGISLQGNRFSFTHERDAVISGLSRIATDLSERRVVLGDLWNNEGKLAYLNRLEVEGLLPREDARLEATVEQRPQRRGRPPIRQRANVIIAADEPEIPWRADQARIRAVWDELQLLDLSRHPNAISACLRILVELLTENYLRNAGVVLGQGFSANFRQALTHLQRAQHIEQDYFDELDRMRQHTEIISISSMQRYVHSPNFAPLPDELLALWVRLRVYVICCLTH